MSQRQVKSHRKKKQFPRANLNRYVVCIPHRGILSKAKLLATKKQVFTIQNSTASWERYLIPVQQQQQQSSWICNCGGAAAGNLALMMIAAYIPTVIKIDNVV